MSSGNLQKAVSLLRERVMQKEQPEPILKPQTLDECLGCIETIITDPRRFIEDELSTMSVMQRRATAGEPEAVQQMTALIEDLIQKHNLLIDGFTIPNLAAEIFKRGYGLGPIHDLYLQPDVIEVRVDRRDLVSVSRVGRNEVLPGVAFASDNDVDCLVQRLLAHSGYDRFDEANPGVNAVIPLAGGTRITAVRPPLSEYPSVILRKLNAFEMTRGSLVRAGTVDERLYNIIAFLHRCGGKVLWLGPPESGKTSWMVAMVSELPLSARIVMIGKDREHRLRHRYPARSVIELEEQPRVSNGTLVDLFALSLKLSPEVVLFDEFLVEEVGAAVMAGERARWFWSTAHYPGPSEAIYGGATLLLRKTPELTYDAAVQQFLRAFNIFIVLHGDMSRGIKKVLGVYVARSGENGVETRTLAEWRGGKEDYWVGEWVFPEKPFEEHLTRMRLFGATEQDFRCVGWS